MLLGTAPVILLPQFLYYQTLVNNDCLLNALAALAILAFTSAVLAAERGNERRFFDSVSPWERASVWQS